MDKRLKLTEVGKLAGWCYMHNGGWVQNPVVSRYSPPSDYTCATMSELESAVEKGEFVWEFGENVHIGGILHTWVPAKNQP